MSDDAQWDTRKVDEIIKSMIGLPGVLLPMLHAIQESQGYIPTRSVPMIASALNQTRAEIHGVISFYHHFQQTPTARNRVEICLTEVL